VLPVDDLGLRRAASRHYFDGEDVGAAELRAFGARWEPWRSVATWYLWRSLEPVPVEY
jgi:DNA-3-methyladenine glycosylase II